MADPKFNEARYHRGEIFEALGQKTNAIVAYQATVAASTRKDDFWTQRAISRIRELTGGN